MRMHPTALLAALAGCWLLAACAAPTSDADTTVESPATNPRRPPPGQPLEEMTSSGVDFHHHTGAAGRHHYVETMSGGVALFDMDGDGDLDLFAVDGGALPGSPTDLPYGNRLFANRGDGTFDEVPAAGGAADRSYGMGVAVGDVDGDGDLDLYVLDYRANALYLNDGSGRFRRADGGVDDHSWSVAGAFFDLEGDGDLDLYVANYLRYDVETEPPCHAGKLEIYCSPEQYPPAGDRLYRNDGGRFTEITAEQRIPADGRGMGVVAADLDADGDLDLYVTNDRSRNFLYENRDGRLVEIGAEVGVAYSPTGQAEGGMGVVAGDWTGTGELGLFFTNFQHEPNRMFMPLGGGFFDDRGALAGLAAPSVELVGWGMGSFDLEGDGDLDLVVANGHVFENAELFISGSSHGLPDQLFVNDGSGRFTVSSLPGEALSSRGIATGDLDGDGDADLAIASAGGPLRLVRNQAGVARRFVQVALEGPKANRWAVGATVRAQIGERIAVAQVQGGGSYASASDLRLTFGLGNAQAIDRLEVRWPDGAREVAGPEAGGQRLLWRHGAGIVSRTPLRGAE